MRFISKDKEKTFFYKSKMVSFKDGSFDTDDKEMIEVMKRLKDVEVEKKPKQEKSDK